MEPTKRKDDAEILPDHVPVTLPELPPTMTITTGQQFKAISEATRSRILGIIQQQPATAKQIADRLGIPPGTAVHHLDVLEEAGLAQVVARRLVRGIVAKYYTRSARLFIYKLPPDVRGDTFASVEIVGNAQDELAEANAASGDDSPFAVGFPHIQVSEERAAAFNARLTELIDDLAREPLDPSGQVYGVCLAMFRAPPYLQVVPELEQKRSARGDAGGV